MGRIRRWALCISLIAVTFALAVCESDVDKIRQANATTAANQPATPAIEARPSASDTSPPEPVRTPLVPPPPTPRRPSSQPSHALEGSNGGRKA